MEMMMETVALFDYTARTNKELSFKTNQIIFIFKQINHQWWLGHIPEINKSGFIPDGYIKFKSKRRNSIPIRHRISSLYSSNNKLDPPLVTEHHSPIPISTNDHDNSSSSSIIDIDRTLHEDKSSLNSQSETDAPDLVLNLPISNGFITSKSFDETIPIVHSTIIIDLEEKQLPSVILKKSIQVIKHLGLRQQSKATEV